jgi:hypothetical protein
MLHIKTHRIGKLSIAIVVLFILSLFETQQAGAQRTRQLNTLTPKHSTKNGPKESHRET